MIEIPGLNSYYAYESRGDPGFGLYIVEVLKPEIIVWALENGIILRASPSRLVSSRSDKIPEPRWIAFEDEQTAMIFKLTWAGT